jgi:hypothetical protein
MKRIANCAVLAASIVTLVVSPLAHAESKVSFVKPEAFVDIPLDARDRDDALHTLRAHFATLAKKLPAGQDLIVEVTDVDLAGRMEPTRLSLAQELRVLRGMADWPMIAFRYRVEASGKALKSGEARVADMNYLRSFNRYPTSEPLRHEKMMLDNWFKSELGTPNP